MGALEAQVKQLGLQAARDCERMAKDRTLTLQLLHKVSLPHNGVYLFHNRAAWRARCTSVSHLVVPFRNRTGCVPWRGDTKPWQEAGTSQRPTSLWKRWAGTHGLWYHKYCKKKLLPSKWIFFNLDELLEQELLHISEPDLVYMDGPPHSPCPSSAAFSSSHIPSPELCPVRLQEVNLSKILFVAKPNKACAAVPPMNKTRHEGMLANTDKQQQACCVYVGRSSLCFYLHTPSV